MFYKAKHRFADVGPRKMRPFAHLIRGKNVDEAIEALRFYHNRGARLIEAVVKSAFGNAEDQNCPNLEDLVVHEVRIDGGPMFAGLSAALLHRSVDAAVLVYNRSLTAERGLTRAREVLDAGGIPVIGIAETFAT